MLKTLVFMPVVAALLVAALPSRRAGASWHVATLCGTLVLGWALFLASQFDPAQTAIQLHESRAWNVRLGSYFALGLDGLSLAMVLLTAVLTLIALLASRRIARGARLYFPLVLLLESAMFGVFTARDWSLRGLHNVELVRERDRMVHHPVPYDFDLSGIVNTRYAAPDPRLRLGSVRDRLYRGPCLAPAHWEAVFARFRDRKADLYALYRGRPGLSPRYVEETERFLDGFYQAIDDPARVARELVRRCHEEEVILPPPR